MRIHSVCGYRSKSDEWTDKWSNTDFRARNLVKAVKREQFGGYSGWTVRATKQELRVDATPEGQLVALRVAVSLLLGRLAAAGISQASIVPVPSSSRVSAADEDFTCGRLARAIHGLNPDLVPQPVLYFDAPQPKTHDAGSRRWQDILPHLRSGNLAGIAKPVILLDDVMTSGGHLRARSETC